ncbi:RES domain protein [Desulfovibrio sp. A2]|nr:RES domain protein [Desulfovibrio sp. A2]
MRCCGNCFSDIFLAQYIENESRTYTACDTCGAYTRKTLDPKKLRDFFEILISSYSQSEIDQAKDLYSILKSDWGIFENINKETADTLLTKILGSSAPISKLYIPIDFNTESIVSWDCFCEEITSANRFFFRTKIDLESIQGLFDLFLKCNGSIFNNKIYRARINTKSAAFGIEEMGPPPATLAKGGRANPTGIPYLYSASTPETAIAETRPHPGDTISIVSIETHATIELLNLHNPKSLVSPFTIQEDAIPKLRRELAFLCKLDEDLSQPILPRNADIDYLPTQYLCEFIKNCGYHGVTYKSSVHSGTNIALFGIDHITYNSVSCYKISTLNYTHSVI